MWRIPRPPEPGVYDLGILEGEEIAGITFSNKIYESFNILTTTGKLFIVGLNEDGHLSAVVVDISDIADQTPN